MSKKKSKTVASKPKAGIYVRLSKEDRAKGDNLEEQIQTCRDYADREALEVVATYVDDGIGGAKIDRPGIQDAITAAKAGEFQNLIVREHDRFARDVTVAGLLADQFKLAGVPIHYEQLGGPIDTDEVGGFWQDHSMKGQAHAERLAIRKRVMRGKYRAAREGKIIISWRVPYGYKRKRMNADEPTEAYTTLEVAPGEVEVVQRIFKDFLAGKNYSEIVRRLNDAGIPRHEAYPWTVKNVGDLIRNETYAGTWYYGRYKAKTYRVGMEDKTERWTVPDDDPTVVAVDVEPIISREVFDKAQIKAETIARINAKQHKYFYLLRGLITCTECGLIFTATTLREKYGYYIHNRRNRECVNGSARFSQGTIESEVKAALIDQLTMPDEKWIELLKAQTKGKTNGTGRLKKIKEDRAKLAKRLAGYQEMRADGELSKEDFAKRAEETYALDRVLAEEEGEQEEPDSEIIVIERKSSDPPIPPEHIIFDMKVQDIQRKSFETMLDEDWAEVLTRYNVRLEVRTRTERDLYSDLGGVIGKNSLLIQ